MPFYKNTRFEHVKILVGVWALIFVDIQLRVCQNHKHRFVKHVACLQQHWAWALNILELHRYVEPISAVRVYGLFNQVSVWLVFQSILPLQGQTWHLIFLFLHYLHFWLLNCDILICGPCTHVITFFINFWNKWIWRALTKHTMLLCWRILPCILGICLVGSFSHLFFWNL